MVNLPTKFVVSTFSRYGDMKCVRNPQNGSGLGWLGVIQGHRKCRHSIERIRLPIRLLIETMRLSCTVFEILRVIYPTPPPFGAPLGVTPFEFRKDFWRQKIRVPGLSCGVVCVILSVACLLYTSDAADE